MAQPACIAPADLAWLALGAVFWLWSILTTIKRWPHIPFNKTPLGIEDHIRNAEKLPLFSLVGAPLIVVIYYFFTCG